MLQHLDLFSPQYCLVTLDNKVENLFIDLRIKSVGLDRFFSKHRPSGPMLSISRFVGPSVRLFTFEEPFKHLSAPNSWSWMSNIFRDSKSLRKSNGKKWSQIWTFLFGICLKSPNSCFFWLILPTKQGGNHSSWWIWDRWSKGISLILAYFWTFLSFCVLDDFFCFSNNFGF